MTARSFAKESVAPNFYLIQRFFAVGNVVPSWLDNLKFQRKLLGGVANFIFVRIHTKT